MSNYLLIALGGSIGALVRYLIANKLETAGTYFQLNILMINFIGCFIVGIVIAILDSKSQLFLFFSIGLLGSFTTMSAFSTQALELIINQKYLIATTYITLTVLSCIIATVLAYYLFKT
tara:strand:+ start:2519 stop:2875 length:357 start_codon:yes stop_codon:yes gene_type:complete